MKPLIGMVCHIMPTEPKLVLNTAYTNSIIAAGGEPVILPLYGGVDCSAVLERLDGIVFTGGADVAPLLYGEEPRPQVTACWREEDEAEIAYVKAAIKTKLPILGICRGQQIVNVALGGTLIQDIPSQTENKLCHCQSMVIRSELTHSVKLSEGSKLYDILKGPDILVNSFHHQAVKDLGEGLKVVGTAPDGVIEAIESEDGNILCVQWHPEALSALPQHRGLFEAFVERCR